MGLTDTSVEELLEILRDENQPVPVGRLSEFSDLDSNTMEVLEKTWRKVPPARRRVVLEELGQLADLHFELTFERVNRMALTDQDAQVRCIAIGNLWECEDPSLVPSLIEALQGDGASEVRAAAASALGRFIYLGEVDQIPETMLRNAEGCLIDATESDPSDEVQLRCLEALGYSSREEVIPYITQAYESGNEERLKAALLAMGRSANDRWGPEVLAELNNPDPGLRVEAIRAAGELELREAVPTLIEHLEDGNTFVRRASIWSLGQLGGQRAGTALGRMFDDAEDENEAALLEDALDHLAFVDSTRDMLLFDFDEPDDLED